MIKYDGPAFREREYLGKFRTTEKEADIFYHLTASKVMELPNLPCIRQKDYVDVFGNAEQQVRVLYGRSKAEIIMTDSTCDGKNHLVKINEAWIGQMNCRLVLSLFDIPHQVLNHGGIFLHASYILWKGKAILFTAPKQTGKTTQAKLWETYAHAEIINGDRALLRRTAQGWKSYGSPYCGTSKICENVSAPLGSVVILSQASENRIRKASTREAVIAFMDGATFQVQERYQVELAAELIDGILSETAIYKLECTPTEEAVRTLEEMLWEMK